jgi:DNA-directed RNA polymerase subunit N (RpoN/RPB10)
MELLDIDDLVGELPYDEYSDLDAVEVYIPNKIETLSFIRCPQSGCGRNLSKKHNDFYQMLDDAQRIKNSLSGRGMTSKEYNDKIKEILDQIAPLSGPESMRHCCRTSIFETPIIETPIISSTSRYIKAYGKEVGNVKIEAFDENYPYNPYSIGDMRYQHSLVQEESEKVSSISDTDSESDFEPLMTQKIKAKFYKFNDYEDDLFPSMPSTEGFDFSEEKWEEYLPDERMIVTGIVHTGIKGMESYNIKGRKILAR